MTAVVPKEQEFNPEKAMNEKIRKLKEVLDGCVAGRRMLIELEPDDVFEFVEKCPKCKHEQSWAPRLASGLFKKTRQKRADRFNAAPVLSKPDFVFGGDLPEEGKTIQLKYRQGLAKKSLNKDTKRKKQAWQKVRI